MASARPQEAGAGAVYIQARGIAGNRHDHSVRRYFPDRVVAGVRHIDRAVSRRPPPRSLGRLNCHLEIPAPSMEPEMPGCPASVVTTQFVPTGVILRIT